MITIVLLIMVLLFVAGDKVSTIYAVKASQQNYDLKEPFQVERNPLARLLFQKQGLVLGSITMGFLHVLLWLFFCIPLLTYAFGRLPFTAPNAVGISWYLMFMMHGWIIANNLYFCLRFGGYLP